MSSKSVKENLIKIAPDLEIIEHDKSTASVNEAALAHNVDPGQIVKTIALILDEPILIMVAGNTKIDNKKYKMYQKKQKCSQLAIQNYITPIGGVCPFGLPSNLPIYADKSLEDYGYVIPTADQPIVL